ncbi:MAG: YvcK family protein, partial [Peptococcaceae bacterium]|nr:YvcK family protein [Peptococcaceae bacterium]
VTTADAWLEAEFENGAKVLGESKIFYAKKEQKCRISHVRLVPDNPPALPQALTAIGEADMIVLGPGSLYTSIIPNLLVRGVAEAVRASGALRVYVCNIMTQEGETEGYTAYDHVRELLSHGGENLVDTCLANSAPVPVEMLSRYEVERAWPTWIDRERFGAQGFPILVERPMYGQGMDYARHDPAKLTYELFRLFCEQKPREGIFAELDAIILHGLQIKAMA